MAENSGVAAHVERQLVIFDLAAESYGVDINAVQGIIRMQTITKVPRTPEFVEGVINLRGEVIPVVDRRTRFGLTVTEETNDVRIVVVYIGGQQVGLVVDAVTEVLRISADSIEPPSSVITSADSAYLLGIAKLEDRLITILDLEQALSEAEKNTLAYNELYAQAGEVQTETATQEAPVTVSASVQTSEVEAAPVTSSKKS
ncbi:MAG: chemotaxis protein CheW [Dehalococcoidia bacterium]